MDPRYNGFTSFVQKLNDKDPTGLVSGSLLIAGLLKGGGQALWNALSPGQQPTLPTPPTYTPYTWQPPKLPAYHPENITTTVTRQPPTPSFTTPPAGNTDFLKTKFMQSNQAKNIPLERQLRWDPNRKKYITVGKWMKEQEPKKKKKGKV